jgi:arabinose-5-phosphate isomerase
MSAKSFGCVGVAAPDGTLAGIITDGDLRRHMTADLMTLPVGAVMTPMPMTISGNMLAAEALDLLNSMKRTTLFIVDEENRPQGIVHLHDLLRLGVA